MKACIAVCFFFVSFFSISQTLGDTTTVGLTPMEDTASVHSVKKAVLFSALLPGAGQIYNHIAMPKGRKKAYWKVPLIYAGLGVSTYFLITNNNLQKELRQEYTNRTEDGGSGPSDKWSAYDDFGILTLFDTYQNWRDLSILAIVGVYGLQVLDAGVEAHFVNFDISEDLTLNIRPQLNLQTAGVAFRFNFH